MLGALALAFIGKARISCLPCLLFMLAFTSDGLLLVLLSHAGLSLFTRDVDHAVTREVIEESFYCLVHMACWVWQGSRRLCLLLDWDSLLALFFFFFRRRGPFTSLSLWIDRFFLALVATLSRFC